MSSISTIYDAIDSFMIATFPQHKEMVNPYEIEANDDFILNKGYGFYLGPAINTNRQIDCYFSVQRDLVVCFTRINRGTDRDKTIRKEAEKLILEDHFLMGSELDKDPTVNSLVSKLVWSSDGGIEFVYPDRVNFLKITMTFALEYLEHY